MATLRDALLPLARDLVAHRSSLVLLDAGAAVDIAYELGYAQAERDRAKEDE